MTFLLTKEKMIKILAKSETALNLIGYIPVISSMSGLVRMVGGKIQALIGFFVAAFSLFTAFKSVNKFRALLIFRIGLEHLLHGICNLIRGSIETVPLLSLVLCLPYDHLLKKRFKYSSEDEDLDIIEVKGEEI